MQNFNEHIAERKRQKASLDSKRQDLEEDIETQRFAHTAKVSEQAQLQAEAKVGLVT